MTNVRQMKTVAATAEIPRPPQGVSAWAKARWAQQIREWFKIIPDFLLTFSAPIWIDVDCDWTRCAIAEHELLHCAQAVDGFGVPRFSSKDGKPVWALKGHDAEEHVDIVARYGVGAAAGGVRELVEAASRPPLIGQAQISIACGYCLR